MTNIRSALRHTSLALVLAVAAACSSEQLPVESRLIALEEPWHVVAEVGVESAAPGALLPVLFRNTVDATYIFNPCARLLQRQDAGEWSAPIQEMRLCTDLAYVITPNGTRTESVDVPVDLAPGTYRFTFSMHAQGSPATEHQVVSNSFEVR